MVDFKALGNDRIPILRDQLILRLRLDDVRATTGKHSETQLPQSGITVGSWV
jgi:hypothetical protein